MRIFRVLAIIFLSLAIVVPSEAQLSRRKIKKNNRRMSNYHGSRNTFNKYKRYKSLGLALSSYNYLGDIAPRGGWGSTNLGFTRPGVMGSFEYRMGPRYTLRTALSWGRLQSDDYRVADPNGDNSKYRYIRNASFRNDIWELQAVGVIDLYKNDGSYLNRIHLTPYFLAGAAVYHHNPKGKVPNEFVARYQQSPIQLAEAGQWVALRPLGTEGQYANLDTASANYGIKPYSLWQFAIPIGIGIRYRLADALDISMDFTFKWLFTDYIDDVSRQYVDLGVLDSDLARAMSYRGSDPVSATGEPRNIDGWTKINYTGADGVQYEVINGFGAEGLNNKRGGSNVNDVYFVTSIRIAYVLGGKFRRAKFR